MRARAFSDRRCRLVVLAVAAAGILLGAGCTDEPVAPGPQKGVHLWIDDGPDKPQTSIRIDLPEGGHIELTVRDHAGGLVRVLFDGVLVAGQHAVAWDGRDEDGEAVSSGPYWAVATDGHDIQATAMMLIK